MCGFLSRDPYSGTWPATQACALTGNQTINLLVLRLALNLLSHNSQGLITLSLTVSVSDLYAKLSSTLGIISSFRLF